MLPRISLASVNTLTSFAVMAKATVLDAKAVEDILSNSKLVLSVEVCRHGEREPDKVYDFTEDPAQNFSITDR